MDIRLVMFTHTALLRTTIRCLSDNGLCRLYAKLFESFQPVDLMLL